ncbi:hypothetical protein ABE137_12555 [Brevibacillus laterosporus]|nr:hypothetical protein [Brevibacillus laterosporus]MCR8994625.1 hypothetical protein [Brevibacillus laterosporus]
MSLQEKLELVYKQQQKPKQRQIVMQGVALTKYDMVKLDRNIIVR